MEEEHVVIDCDVPSHLVEDLGSSESTEQCRKRYNCDICGYASNQAGNFKTHKLIHTGEKPFKCNVCSYACNRLGYLKTHQLIHSGEKPYKCNVCSYACIDSSTLGKHKRVHSGEKPYSDGRKHKCDFCSYACNKKGNLRRHIQLVHSTQSGIQKRSEKLFKCNQCDYVCPHKGNLRRHILLIHTRESEIKRKRTGKSYKYVCVLRTNYEQINGRECGASSTQTEQLKNQPSSLADDLSAQSLETKHSCSDCSYYTHSLTRLRNHLWQHSEVQNFPRQDRFLQNTNFEAKYFLNNHIIS